MKRKRIAQALLGGAVGFNLRAKAATEGYEEEGEEDRDADEEGEGDEDTPTSAPGSSLAARNPYALLGEDEC